MPNTPRTLDVHEARSAEDLVHAARLFREYAGTLPESAQISLRHQGFEHELATLPGKYARPGGLILLATHAMPGAGSTPVGVVALRELPAAPGTSAGEPRACEMKRLYVQPAARGLKLGRLLCERLLIEAHALGYGMMKLDTEPDLRAAVGLYRSLGFVEIDRYNDDPVPCTLFMGRTLGNR